MEAKELFGTLAGLPELFIDDLSLFLHPAEVTRLALTCKLLYNTLGGSAGCKTRRRVADEIGRRQQKELALEQRRQRRDRQKKNMHKAIVELVKNRGKHGVSYRSIGRKHSIFPVRLRRLDDRLKEDSFYEEPNWEKDPDLFDYFSASSVDSDSD